MGAKITYQVRSTYAAAATAAAAAAAAAATFHSCIRDIVHVAHGRPVHWIARALFFKSRILGQA